MLKINEEEKCEDGKEAQPPQEEMEKPSEVKGDNDATQKKKADDLWASFLSDVGSRPKDYTPASKSSATHKVITS